MKRNLKITFSIGFLLLVAGIIIEFLIRFMAGSIIELRTLEATLAAIALVVVGLIIIGTGLVYKQFGQKLL